MLLLTLFYLQAYSQAAAVSFALQNYKNVPLTQAYYTAQLQLGTPPQPFTLLVDTLHPYIQVDSLDCPDCDTSTRFDSSQSATYRTIKELKTRRWEGEIGQDRALLGTEETLSVDQQAFFLNKRHAETHKLGTNGVFVSH
jgi:hypothetical protein